MSALFHSPATVAASRARWHACARDAFCPTCSESESVLDWSFVDRVYCISLVTRPDRTADAEAQFHRLGLCSRTLFYRPAPDESVCSRPATRGCWESHRAVAMHALSSGARRILVFEDDVLFRPDISPRMLADVKRGLDELPPSWRVFLLGHWPLFSVPISRHVTYSVSFCLHAYVASADYLAWIRDRPYEEYWAHGIQKLVSVSPDAAVAAAGNTFAALPMLAYQSGSPSSHPKCLPGLTWVASVALSRPAFMLASQYVALGWIPLLALLLALWAA